MTLGLSHYQSWNKVGEFFSSGRIIKILYFDVNEGIPKITGTSELFDAHPAIVASYNVIINSEQQAEDETLPPLLFSQFERFLFLIKKYFLLCKVRRV